MYLMYPNHPQNQMHFRLVQPQCKAITYWAWEEEEEDEEEGRAITVDTNGLYWG